MAEQKKQFNYNISRLIEYCELFDKIVAKDDYKRKYDDLENTVKHVKTLISVYQRIGLTHVPWSLTYKLSAAGIEFGLTQPTQGTQEWLNQRLDRISASDIGSALGVNEYKEPEIVIIDKCGYPNKWWWDPVASVRFTHHGHKFEFVASQIHEVDHGVKCYEASFVPHPTIDFIGASPDKFALDEKNKRGYLVEIKCPYRRYPKINVVPPAYWVQMQIQMEVTNLEECYFEDCRILEYYDENAFLEDETAPRHRGVIGAMQDLVAETTHYIYPKLVRDDGQKETLEEMNERQKQEIMEVVKEHRAKSEKYYFTGFTWWQLAMHQSILVLRDRKWFAEALPKLDAFWKKVLWHREHGYDDLVRKFNQPTLAEWEAMQKENAE